MSQWIVLHGDLPVEGFWFFFVICENLLCLSLSAENLPTLARRGTQAQQLLNSALASNTNGHGEESCCSKSQKLAVAIMGLKKIWEAEGTT